MGEVRLATGICGRCVAEHRRRPGVLGHLWKFKPSGVRWYNRDPRWSREERSKWAAEYGDVMAAVFAHYRNHVVLTPGDAETTPEEFTVFCRYHGPGTVRTTDVIAGRGTLVLTFTATTQRR